MSEAIQQALIGTDYSLTKAFLVVLTLVMADVGLSLIKPKFPVLENWLDGNPTIIVENGKLLKDRMNWAQIDEEEILAAARKTQGLERLEQIKYAVLEIGGDISIIPEADAKK